MRYLFGLFQKKKNFTFKQRSDQSVLHKKHKTSVSLFGGNNNNRMSKETTARFSEACVDIRYIDAPREERFTSYQDLYPDLDPNSMVHDVAFCGTCSKISSNSTNFPLKMLCFWIFPKKIAFFFF